MHPTTRYQITKLEARITELESQLTAQSRRLEERDKVVERLREALEWYAEEIGYSAKGGLIKIDRGANARDVLKRIGVTSE